MYIPTKSNNYVCVNESGLYSLIFRSNKPEAKAFKRWVTKEVLPTIRKQGAYADTERKLTRLTPEQIHANLLDLATQLRRKYPHLNINDHNVLLEKKGDASDMRYWADVESLGLPVIRVIDGKCPADIQVEFSFYAWQRFGEAKKHELFQRMGTVCKGLFSYNKARQYAFNGMDTQDTEFVVGFTSKAHAERIANYMRSEISGLLTMRL